MTPESKGPRFEVVAEYSPAGDQPRAIAQLSAGIERGDRFQTFWVLLVPESLPPSRGLSNQFSALR